MTKSLIPYQKMGVDGVVRLYAGGLQRILFQLATGGGKTVCFASLCDRYLKRQQKKILILVHREELLLQAYKTLFDWYDIVAAPVNADTRYLPNTMVYIAMVETANNRLATNPNYFGNIGLVIADEAHLGNFKKIYSFFKQALIVGFTATPISGDKKDPLKNYFQEIVCGVDIPTLIQMGRLVKNRTIDVSSVERSTLKVARNGEFDIKEMSSVYSAGRHVQACVANYKQYTDGQKMIVFNCDVEHSKKVAVTFQAFGYPCRHIDGDTPPAERKKILGWFSATPGAIVCNVDILNAGYDEPTIEVIYINISTQSVNSWLQKTGRGGRCAPGKKGFTILDGGGNAAVHGDWDAVRDWKDAFHNPPKPKEKKGEAPSKVCIGCRYVVPAQTVTCPHCGAVMRKKVEYDPQLVSFEELMMKRPINIDVHLIVTAQSRKLNKKGEPYKDISALHTIKVNIIHHAQRVWKLKRITPTIAQKLLAVFQEKVIEWCQIKQRDPDKWILITSRKWMLEELERAFHFKLATENQKQIA